MACFRYFLLLFVLLLALKTQAQWRLIYRVQDLADGSDKDTATNLANRITLIEPRGSLSHKLIVRYAHAKRELIDRRQIWGYVDGAGHTWRSYGTDDFRIVAYNGHWVEYLLMRVFRNRNGASANRFSLYSRTLESPIRDRWSKAMADAPPNFVIGRTERR